MIPTPAATDWKAWQTSWDRQQEWYMPDREERFRVMLDMTEALVGTTPLVLDLACGTGTITDRLLGRLPGARGVGVDLDPALLAIAHGSFDGDERVRFVTADITDPAWPDLLPHRSYDAVLTATALHWLGSEPLTALYRRLHDVVRDGGVFLNADHMTDESTPRINAAARAHTKARMAGELAEGAQDWAAWWSTVADDPVLAERAQRRFSLFGDPRNPSDVTPPGDRPTTTDWHIRTLLGAGFTEARQVWCSPSDAVVAAVR